MSDFLCYRCKQPVRVTGWDLVPSQLPEKYLCNACGASNKLSRSTLLLSLLPSLCLMLMAGLAHRLWLGTDWILISIVAGYVAGLPIGTSLSRRYGRLVAPYRPLL
jgi:hypothetical protein